MVPSSSRSHPYLAHGSMVGTNSNAYANSMPVQELETEVCGMIHPFR